MPKYFKVERDGPLLIVTINRPEVRNALNAPACHELSGIWDSFQEDSDLWLAIITGEGDKAFSAGHDLLDGFDDPMPPTGFAGMADRTDLVKPLIAAVNGYCFGGGWEIALCCDIIIADERATFSFSEPKVGFAALGGGAERLTARIPAPIAMGMLLTGRRVGAAEAARWGLVTEIAPQGTSLAVARQWAQEIMTCAPRAVQYTKEIALRAIEGPGDHSSLTGRRRELAKELRKLEDTREGIRAFAEKRSPVWKNR
ncbi:MAG: enoyl-CoA hydratase-related protein [Janthinobacterium lividum]